MFNFELHEVKQALARGLPLPAGFVEALRGDDRARAVDRRRMHQERIGGKLRGFPRANRFPPLPMPSPRSGMSPGAGNMPPPLVCFPGWQSLASSSGVGHPWGSDEVPRVGPLADPQPNFDPSIYPAGTVFHKWSAMTQAALGMYSLAVRETNPEDHRGYDPEELEFFGYQGTHADATIGYAFFLPDLAKTGTSVLQALVRLTAPYINSQLVLYTGDSEYSFAAILGFVTVTFSQGIFQPPEARTTAVSDFLDYEMDRGLRTVRMVSPLNDPGYLDTVATLKWDGQSDLFFVDVNLSLHVASMFEPTSRCGGAADMRFGWNDALLVFPDGTDAGQANPGSAPLQLDQVRLCGF